MSIKFLKLTSSYLPIIREYTAKNTIHPGIPSKTWNFRVFFLALKLLTSIVLSCSTRYRHYALVRKYNITFTWNCTCRGCACGREWGTRTYIYAAVALSLELDSSFSVSLTHFSLINKVTVHNAMNYAVNKLEHQHVVANSIWIGCGIKFTIILTWCLTLIVADFFHTQILDVITEAGWNESANSIWVGNQKQKYPWSGLSTHNIIILSTPKQ